MDYFAMTPNKKETLDNKCIACHAPPGQGLLAMRVKLFEFKHSFTCDTMPGEPPVEHFDTHKASSGSWICFPCIQRIGEATRNKKDA